MTEYFNNDADADLEADSTTSYTYDRLGRVSTIVQQTIAGSTSAVRYKSATYAYNATTGQLSTLTRYAYDPVNYTVPDYPDLPPESEDPENPENDDPHYRTLTTTYGYDNYYRLTGADTAGNVFTTPGYPLTVYYYLVGINETYAYNSLNQVTSTSIVRTAKNNVSYTWQYTESHSYVYDNAGQLVSSDSAAHSYNYDADGNRISADGSTYATGEDNQMTSDGTYRYNYDDEGNRTEKFLWTDTDGQGDYDESEKTDVTHYIFDARNRLVRMEHDQDNNGEADSAVDYVYDMFNRRIETITDSNGDGTPNAYEFYIYDGDNIAMDFLDADGPGTASPKLENRYLWGFNVDELLAQDHYTSSTANGTYWTIQDRQNSIRDAVGGDLIIYNWHSTSYTDFGATVAVSGRTFNNTLPSYFRFTYTCQEREATAAFSSILVFRNRVYDVNTAKFLQHDPIEADINSYRYCHNDPINYIDPTGLYSKREGGYAIDDILNSFTIEQGDIKATFTVDASLSKNPPIPSGTVGGFPVQYVGVSAWFHDLKSGNNNSKGTRKWATFKWRTDAQLQTKGGIKFPTFPNGGEIRTNDNWVKDRGIAFETKDDFYDYPGIAYPVKNQEVLLLSTFYAVAIVCTTKSNPTKHDYQLVSTLYYTVDIAIGSGTAGVRVREGLAGALGHYVDSPLPDPGWIDLLDEVVPIV